MSSHNASRAFCQVSQAASSASDAHAQHSQHDVVGAVIVTLKTTDTAGAVLENSVNRRRSHSVDVPLQEATDSPTTPHAVHSTVTGAVPGPQYI
jgi:hypothetical protein